MLEEWLIHNLKVSIEFQYFYEYRKKMMGCSNTVYKFTG